MSSQRLIDILNADIARNQERYNEAKHKGRDEDAAVYAGKELEARRIICLIMAGKAGSHAC